jgi:pimeloyl-ACP methyl ester carboxylesterase/DNA-binding SARP family transcriptional activator
LAAGGDPLQINVLGNLEVLRGGAPVALPPSRKTRALLAYLAVVERPQRRERLCEMFWDVPDDPRGALRWSLSRIRQIAGDALEADRNVIYLRRDNLALDYTTAHRLKNADLSAIPPADLERAADLFRGRFLDDLYLPRCPEFEAWRVANVNEIELLQLRLRRLLIDALRDDPRRALVHAHALLALNPEDGALAAEIGTLAERSRQHAASAGSATVSGGDAGSPAIAPQRDVWQEIRYCTTRDNVRIAYAVSGEGVPIVKAANWMSHLQYEWESPIWRHWIKGLSGIGKLYRYDERGNGMSDWEVGDLSFEAMLTDLESVVAATGVERFVLLGVSRGCALSVAYAARHPERVSRLILYGGYSQGWRARGDLGEIARREAMIMLIREGWGQDNPAFRQMFTSLFVPEATQEQMDWFNELQRKTVPPENAARLQSELGNIDVSDQLGRVTAPTLVLHARDDAVVSLESGRTLAIGIPDARFVMLESKNHILLSHEPAFAHFISEVRRFLAQPEN